jgi:SAM-dependent methyltransferase
MTSVPGRQRDARRMRSPVAVELPGVPTDVEDDYIARNHAAWEGWASGEIAPGKRAWLADELHWGIWQTPEAELDLLAGFGAGEDVLELGCGTGAVCALLARSRLRPVGVDFAHSQLRTAEALQREFGIRFPLVPANAESVHFDSESFDLVFSEYGASLWCEPRRWIQEAHRLLRPEGRLVFVTSSPLLVTCTPYDGTAAVDRLVRDHFPRYRIEFDSTGPVEFHLSHSNWVRLLRAVGFQLDDLIEVEPVDSVEPRFGIVTSAWGSRWPSEDIWVAHKSG